MEGINLETSVLKRLFFVSFLLIFAPDALAQETPTAVKVDKYMDDLPAPVSIEPSLPEKARPADPLENIAKSLGQIGPERVVVVLGIVKSSIASQRRVPAELYWGDTPQVVTTLELQPSRILCGKLGQEVPLQVNYVGGILDNGTVALNEYTPRPFAANSEHVFILREIGGEYFLGSGSPDVIRKTVDGHFKNSSGNRVDIDRITRICP